MNSITLPDSLVTQLRGYETRLRRLETLAAVAGGIVGLFATFVLLFVLDRFVDTPRWARAILTLSGGALVAWFAQGWAAHWLWNRRGPAELAKLLQRHFKSLGDRLQGVIELTETRSLAANVSPALMRAAIRQVAEESGRFDFANAVPVRPARRWALAAIVLAALTAAPFVFAPQAALNALARWLQPWAPIERYTFASIDDLPAELVVAHGEAFEIACGLKEDSVWRPQNAKARLNAAETVAKLDKDGRVVFRIAGQTQNGQLALRIGDATRAIGIRPLHRPEMKELAARVEMPGYLGYPATKVAIQGSRAEFLEGSSVRFAGKTSRALQSATMKHGDTDPVADLEGETFVTPARPAAELVGDAIFRWADKHGLTPTQPYTVQVSTVKDGEPRVDLQGVEQSIAILPNEVLKLNFTASDDYGLKSAWLGWTVRSMGEKKDDLGKGEAARTAGGQTKKELAVPTEFSPAWQNIPVDSVVELAAYAVDFLPDRKPVQSWKHTIYVLSPAKHAEHIRERMDEVLKQLDERIRDEERQLEETKALAEAKPDKPSEKSGEEIKKAEASERANQAALEKMTAEMSEVMKDALRNKDVPESTLAEWQKLKEEIEKKASPPMEKAAESLAQGAQKPGERSEKLAEAQKQQEEALAALREAAKKLNTQNENLYARNFYNRLKAAAAAEFKISEGLKALAKDTVGLKPEEIAEGKKSEFNRVAGSQDLTTKDVGSIANDMTAFIKRVPNEKYEKVQQEMQEKKIVPELNELAGFVRANLGLKSVGRAKQWGTQLEEWAKMLQKEKPPGESQGMPGEEDPELMELVVAMVRAAQAEDNIREQTDLLEGRKNANEKHTEDAKKLATQQSDLSDTVGILREKTKFGEVKPLLEKVEFLMDETAGNLRQAKTDAEVVSLQGTIIELLVPPDDKSSESQSQSQSKMQQMMQKMMAQMTKGNQPGKGNNKAPSPFAGSATEGAAGRGKGGSRSVEKGTGASDAGQWPEEFRDQLQSYFQQLDGVK
ncbi:MAG: hypothetical protein DVB27_02825 [Verrucomicrobia bacterium]|nr:MAG: hypothetical protein DVB27_02825 [Verrucomicrobiota bacterium]